MTSWSALARCARHDRQVVIDVLLAVGAVAVSLVSVAGQRLGPQAR
jgi:hypothetical protein